MASHASTRHASGATVRRMSRERRAGVTAAPPLARERRQCAHPPRRRRPAPSPAPRARPRKRQPMRARRRRRWRSPPRTPGTARGTVAVHPLARDLSRERRRLNMRQGREKPRAPSQHGLGIRAAPRRDSRQRRHRSVTIGAPVTHASGASFGGRSAYHRAPSRYPPYQAATMSPAYAGTVSGASPPGSP